MDKEQYRSFYDQVGKINGWNFSNVKSLSEGVQWDFFEEVAKRCMKSDLLLDIGTGGGEALLKIADFALLLVGIDLSAAMIETANENLLKAKKANVRFLRMDAGKLGFPEQFFNVVTCRQSVFSAAEAARVLVKDGLFLTQQVCEADKLNIKQAFGRNYGYRDGALKDRCLAELQEAGFSYIQSFEYDAGQYFQTPEDLIFLLKHAPIIPNFGERDEDFEILSEFIANNRTPKGIRTNLKRFMIIAKK